MRGGGEDKKLGLLTREELAQVLKVSLRTVDLMIHEKEIVPVRPGGRLVRFYLPDVVRQLTARALISKRGCARKFMPCDDGGKTPLREGSAS